MKINWTNALLFVTFLIVSTLLFAGLSQALDKAGSSLSYGKAEVAYWAQAIFAFITIFVAIYILREQGNHAATLMIRADERALRRRVDSIGAILDEACRQIWSVGNEIQGTEEKRFNQENDIPELVGDDRKYAVAAVMRCQGKPQFENIIRVIDTIPLHETGSQEMVRAIFSLREALVSLDSRLAHAWHQSERQFKDDVLWNSASLLPRVAQRAKGEFDAAADALFSK